jgi:hypothetical protein
MAAAIERLAGAEGMKLVFVNIMQELQRFDSTAYITQPPVPVAVLNGVPALYDRMRRSGDVTEDWWLKKASPSNCNHLLPSCFSMDFKHPRFSPLELQQAALRLMIELNPMDLESVSRILRVGRRGRALKFAATLVAARERSVRQARVLLRQVEQAMTAHGQRAAGGMPADRPAVW